MFHFKACVTCKIRVRLSFDALLVFLKWFMLVRKMEHCESEIAELSTVHLGNNHDGKAQGSVCRKNHEKLRLE
jgi:hypothetical protein